MQNNNKSKEFGRDNAITPSAGQRLRGAANRHRT